MTDHQDDTEQPNNRIEWKGDSSKAEYTAEEIKKQLIERDKREAEIAQFRLEEQENLTARSRILLEAARLEFKAAQLNVQRAMGLGVLPAPRVKVAKGGVGFMGEDPKKPEEGTPQPQEGEGDG